MNTSLDHDFDDAVLRSHEHTAALVESMDGDVKRLWEGYGIVADVEVSLSLGGPRSVDKVHLC